LEKNSIFIARALSPTMKLSSARPRKRKVSHLPLEASMPWTVWLTEPPALTSPGKMTPWVANSSSPPTRPHVAAPSRV
jgi:hypothetical protein